MKISINGCVSHDESLDPVKIDIFLAVLEGTMFTIGVFDLGKGVLVVVDFKVGVILGHEQTVVDVAVVVEFLVAT